jgi:hypothetical protein
LRNREFARGEAKASRRANSCLSRPQDTCPAALGRPRRAFQNNTSVRWKTNRKNIQLFQKMGQILYALLIFPFSVSKINVNWPVSHVKKTSNSPKKHSRLPNIRFRDQSAEVIVMRYVSAGRCIAGLSRLSNIFSNFHMRSSYSPSVFRKNARLLKKTSNLSK